MFKDTIHGRQLRKNILISIASILVLVYILAPIYWIVNTSFQREAALEDKPPHLFPHRRMLSRSAITNTSLQATSRRIPR